MALNHILSRCADTLHPNLNALIKPVAGEVLCFAPENWSIEVLRLEITLALWVVELLPSWGCPAPEVFPLVFVPEADIPGVTDEGCPATHRVEFQQGFVVFVHRTSNLHTCVVPMDELVAGVIYQARSWLPSIGPRQANLYMKSTLMNRHQPIEMMGKISTLPQSQDQTKCISKQLSAFRKLRVNQLACLPAPDLSDLLTHRRMTSLATYSGIWRMWSARTLRIFTMSCRYWLSCGLRHFRTHLSKCDSSDVDTRAWVRVAFGRLKRAFRRSVTYTVWSPPIGLENLLMRRYLWILRVRLLRNRIQLVGRCKRSMLTPPEMASTVTSSLAVQVIPHYIDVFVGAEVVLSTHFVHMGLMSTQRLIEHAVACGNPRSFLSLFVQAVTTQETIAMHQCRRCRCNMMEEDVVSCNVCDARYCSETHLREDHAQVRRVVCYRIVTDDHRAAMIMRTNVLKRIAIYVRDELLRDDLTLAKRLSVDNRKMCFSDAILAMIIGVLVVQSGRAMNCSDNPPALVMRSLARQLKGATAFAELVTALRPLIRGDEWIETLIDAVTNNRELQSRRATRAVMAACFAERLIIPGAQAQAITTPFWRRNDPDAYDSVQLVIPSNVRHKMQNARHAIWRLLVPSACPAIINPQWPGSGLFVPGGSESHPLINVGDTRRGYGAMHTIIRELVMLEYDEAPGNKEMAVAMSSQLLDPLSDDGGHPLLRDMILSIRQQMGLRFHQQDAMSLLDMATRDDSPLRTQLDSASAQCMLAQAFMGTLRPNLVSKMTITFATNALRKLDMQPRAVFGVLRTALYANGHSRDQTVHVLADTIVGIPELFKHQCTDLQLVEGLTGELLILETIWPTVMCWNGNPLRRIAYWLLGDWYNMCQHSRSHDLTMISLVLSDRCATPISQLSQSKSPAVIDDAVVQGHW
jgi:hypothetical protein